MDCCPFCKSKNGFYYKEKVSGLIHYKENFDGSEADNSAMYDHLSHKRSKSAYCQDCHKRLPKSVTH